MVPPPGTRDSRRGGLLFAAGRFVGFCLLAGTSLGILAAVLLLPEYARLVRVRHELAGWRAATADKEAQIKANERLMAALPKDPVLTKRLAMNQHGLLPADEVVVATSASPPQPPPALVRPPRHARGAPPSGWVMRAARRLARPPLRRGLLLLAGVAMLAALFLFAPRERQREER
jgi:hypothetical protein